MGETHRESLMLLALTLPLTEVGARKSDDTWKGCVHYLQ